MPETIGGHYMANLVTRPTLIEFYHLMTEDIDSSICTEEMAFENLKEAYKNKSIFEMDFRKNVGVNIIAIKDKDEKFIINPSPETVISSRMKIIALGTSQQILEMKNFYTRQ
jgi:voltage-gated potassium channel